MSYPAIGNIARLKGSFYQSDGVTPADPTVVTVVIKVPQQLEQTFTPARDSVGQYHYDLTLTVPGDYHYRFIGTGAVTAQTADGSFNVPGEAF